MKKVTIGKKYKITDELLNLLPVIPEINVVKVTSVGMNIVSFTDGKNAYNCKATNFIKCAKEFELVRNYRKDNNMIDEDKPDDTIIVDVPPDVSPDVPPNEPPDEPPDDTYADPYGDNYI